MITQARLKELLHYCPDLGIFWWKERPGSDRFTKTWNTRFAGTIAGKRTAKGYGEIKVDGRPRKAHRLAWLYMTGEWPPDQIDHRNGWRLDNAFDNLRSATASQNGANSRSYSKTGFKGVTRARDKFQAQIANNGRNEYLGLHATPELAHAAYAKRAKELFGEFARLT